MFNKKKITSTFLKLLYNIKTNLKTTKVFYRIKYKKKPKTKTKHYIYLLVYNYKDSYSRYLLNHRNKLLVLIQIFVSMLYVSVKTK